MSKTLVIGNKAYSSWSMRPWIALRHLGVPFEDVVLPLDTPEFKKIFDYSPAGRVPVLIDGDVTVWDSLAILDHLAEEHPELWPADRVARAYARSISAEMHSGFSALRQQFSMNVRRKMPGRTPSPEAAADIARIKEIWQDARARFGSSGAFLFGPFTAADAMYAPVVTRFDTYGLTGEDPVAEAYVASVMALPAMRDWIDGAAAEPWVLQKYEV